MTGSTDWSGRVGQTWADEWRRTERALTGVAAVLDAAIDRIAPREGRAVDIGCGVGSTSLALAAGRPALTVVGVDLSAPLLDVARARLAESEEGRARAQNGARGDAGVRGDSGRAEFGPDVVTGEAASTNLGEARVFLTPTPIATPTKVGVQLRHVADARCDNRATTCPASTPDEHRDRMPEHSRYAGDHHHTHRPTIHFEHGDARDIVPALAPLDLLVSRHGVMFFDDPLAAFDAFADSARPDAPLVFSCFRGREQNKWVAPADAIAGTPPPPAGYQPGPFAFADPAFLRDLLVRAGWGDVDIQAHDVEYCVGAGDDPLADAIGFYRRIGPAAAVLAAAAPSRRAALEAQLADRLVSRIRDGAITFSAAIHIVTARRRVSA